MLATTKRQAVLSLAALALALLACKRFSKEEPAPVVSSSPNASASVAASAAPEEPAGPKIGDVKRYPDKEKTDDIEGAVKTTEADVKVYNEADEKTPHVATLNKGIYLRRVATMDDWLLVEFPSGVGELSPGWILAKTVSEEEKDVTHDALVHQKAAKLAPNVKKPKEEKSSDAGTKDKEEDKSDAGTKQAADAGTKPDAGKQKEEEKTSTKPAPTTSTSAKPAPTTSGPPPATTSSVPTPKETKKTNTDLKKKKN